MPPSKGQCNELSFVLILISLDLRNELATVNAWHASQTSTAAAISFDGSGYLFVEEFSTSSFSSSLRHLTITLRPNDESDGLVIYAYDSTVSSVTVFLLCCLVL